MKARNNPETGESGWMLSGMIAGGMTAWSLDRWSAVIAGILANTYAEPANYDPASARYIQKIAATDMENGLVGDPLPHPLQVKVTDSSHQPVTGALVTFTRKAGGGSLAGTDAEGNQVTGASITVPTNPSGIASARLTLGISTAANPTFMKLLDSHNQIYGEAFQVGENIVDAALASGTGIAAPFTAYGFPKGPHHMKKLFGDGYWSAVLSFAGYLKVGIEDVHNNPVSNVKLNFTVSDPVPNPDYSACYVQNSRPAYLIPQGTACVNDIPAWGTCGDTSAQTLPVTSGSAGALAYVVLGGMPQALYTIQVTCVNPADPGLCTDPATGQPFKTTFTLKTFPWGNCSGYEPPYDVLIGMYVEPVDSYGMNINAGKTGTTIPLQTKLYYLEEGDTTVNFTYTGCSDGTMTCPLIVGTKQYTIDTGSSPDTKFTESKVTFTPQGSAPVVVTTHDNNGLYRTQHVLTSGINTITVEGTATIQRDISNNTCNGCGTLPNQPITQNVMSTVTVYGVNIALQDPGPVFVEENGYSLNNLTVQYTINPAEYKANTAYVMVYKDGEYITAIQAEKQGTGTATISRGFWFDINKRYEVQVVLNYGSGVEIRSDKVRLTLTTINVELVDTSGNPVSTIQIGDYENFVSWKTLELRYRITPALPDADYYWTVAPGVAERDGHPYLGTIDVENPNLHFINDKLNRTLTLNPITTGSQRVGDTRKAKPLAFEINLYARNQLVKTFKIEQSYRNALRQEYKATGATVMVEVNDFEGPLDNNIYLTSPYDRVDIPKVSNIHTLRNNLLTNKYYITSSYRNPYKNLAASDTGTRSRHVWSGAVDVVDKTTKLGYIEELREVWLDAQTKPWVFGTVLVEAGEADVEKALSSYIIRNRLLPIGSSIAAVVIETISSHNSYNGGPYIIAWSTVAQWGNITFWWVEQNASGTYIPHLDQQYQLKGSDWQSVARNLHLQDRQNGSVQEGF